MSAYYNEHDPYAAQWLRNLIAAGHIAPGVVDERSIEDVLPTDLAGFTQCHFFAGIGGWSYALRISGVSDDLPLWTGSCPCQPFSAAGKGKGAADERHLWPAWFHLIEQCKPSLIFGEQVEAAIRHGWLDLVQDDLEGIGYAFGAVGLPAACVGAPHIRQRLWFVAESSSSERDRSWDIGARRRFELADSGNVGELADTMRTRRAEGRPVAGEQSPAIGGEFGLMADANGGDSATERQQRSGQHGQQSKNGLTGFWSRAEWFECSDEKSRPIEPGIFPLADGLSGRISQLRAAGNAIVPQIAQAFIESYMRAA